MRYLCLSLFLLVVSCRLTSSQMVVSTLVGSGTAGTSGGVGTSARLHSPFDVIISSSGEYAYISDYDNHAIRRYAFSTGQVTFFAGSTSGTSGYTDATGTSAKFNGCSGLVMHSSGNYFFVADEFNNRVRRVDVATAVVTTIAGSNSQGNSDGTGTSASFNTPIGITMDSGGTYLIVTSTNRIRRIAGLGPGYINGVGTNAKLYRPSEMIMSPDDTYILVADRENNLVRNIRMSDNDVSHFAVKLLRPIIVSQCGIWCATDNVERLMITPSVFMPKMSYFDVSRRISLATGTQEASTTARETVVDKRDV